MTADDRIRAAIARRREPIDTAPKSAYELQTRAQLDALAQRVAELQTRVNALLWALVAAVLIGIVLDVAGVR